MNTEQLTQIAGASASGLSAGGDVGDKFQVAKDKKAAGDEAFKAGDIQNGACPLVPT